MDDFSSKNFSDNVLNIQNSWAESIVNIGKAYVEKKDYISITNKFLDELYYFKGGKVLFKPTKAKNKQFRSSKNEFLSYFIGHDKVSEEDKGFALEPWKNISFKNFDFLKIDNFLLSMGNYYFTDYEDNITKVEFSFGYTLDDNKNLKIIFHHSSLPYNG